MGNIRIITIVCLMLVVNKVVGQEGVVLNVPWIPQGNDRDLCWAAVGAEIVSYYQNRTIQLCEFVAAARPDSCKNCCKEGLPDRSKYCGQAGYLNLETKPTMAKFGVNVGTEYEGHLTFKQCITEINKGRPIIFRQTYRWLGQALNGNHVMVLNGYKKGIVDTIYYVDSGNDGYKIAQYDWLVKHSDAATVDGKKWISSWKMENSPNCVSKSLFFYEPITINKQVKASHNISVGSVISSNNTTFEFGDEFTATSGFEVKLGSSVEIKPNSTLKCQ